MIGRTRIASSTTATAEASGQSVGNLYHHFGSKEVIFQRLIDDYWERLLDPTHELQQVFERANFPDDLEELATAIERTVELQRVVIRDTRAAALAREAELLAHNGGAIDDEERPGSAGVAGRTGVSWW